MQAADDAGHNRRGCGRIRSQDVVTRFGDVMDISASGMRVMCDHHQPPATGSILYLELRHPQGYVEVKSRVVRVTPLGEQRYELGIAFEDVGPTTAAGLILIARLAMQSIAVDHPDPQSEFLW
jgi:hypothetical protein